MRRSIGRLKPALDRLYADYNRAAAPADPVEVVRRYRDPADREVAGFFAASLAFGRVAGIMQSIERVLDAFGPAPAAFVRQFESSRDAGRLATIVHRWTRGADLAALTLVLRRMMEEAGSIEAFFAAGDDGAADDLGPAIESFSRRALEIDLGSVYGLAPPRPGVAYFFPRPSSGSACKRINLFLRWMVRQDAIDPGGWRRPLPARLVIPLDTHVVRVARCLRLTRYRSPGWRMAADITRNLRSIDPVDPVRYDFSLCHLGMANLCGYGRPQRDHRCPLRGACHPRAR